MNDYNRVHKLCYKLVVISAWAWHCVFISNLLSDLCYAKPQAAPATAASTAVNTKPAAGAEAVKVAVIAAAISEERREPLNSFVITNIKKL